MDEVRPMLNDVLLELTGRSLKGQDVFGISFDEKPLNIFWRMICNLVVFNPPFMAIGPNAGRSIQAVYKTILKPEFTVLTNQSRTGIPVKIAEFVGVIRITVMNSPTTFEERIFTDMLESWHGKHPQVARMNNVTLYTVHSTTRRAFAYISAFIVKFPVKSTILLYDNRTAKDLVKD